MLPEATEVPDLSGLPVYHVNVTMEERVGDEVRVLHGSMAFGQIVWSHVEVWPVGAIMQTADRCTQLSMRPKSQRGPVGH